MADSTVTYEWAALVYKADPDRDKEPPIEYEFSNGRTFDSGPNRSAYEEDE